jgi:putative protease
MPGKPNAEYDVTWMKNADEEELTRANKPMDIITMEIPFEVHEKDILRRLS